jgi:type VI secretion system protein ImpA
MTEQQDNDWRTQILAPFEGTSPAGEDLRLDATPKSLYYRLRDARAAARAEERASENDPAASDADSTHWRTVQTLATEALQTRAKDIEIAAWLTESLTRHDGLAGLAEGAAILTGLIAQFWDAGLFPAADPAEPGERLMPIGGLSGAEREGSLLQPLRKTVLFQSDDGNPVTFWVYERSKELSVLQAAGQQPKGAAANVPAFANLEATAQSRGRTALVAVGRDAVRALSAWQELESTISGVVSADIAPSTGRLRGLLESLHRTVERYVPASELVDAQSITEQGAQSVAEQEVENALEVQTEDDVRSGVATRPAVTRDGMLETVLQIAETFRRHEPNSPFGYTLEEAVRRARLPWPDLLREMMPDPAPRSTIMAGFGLKPHAE